MTITNQRKGTTNASVGRKFETAAKIAIENKIGNNLILDFSYKKCIGIESCLKEHKFDLGNKSQKIIVECKSHRWTIGNNVPSAKLTIWNEAMYYFSILKEEYLKIFFVAEHLRTKSNKTESLVEYYIRTRKHLIPNDVEIWEYNENNKNIKIWKYKDILDFGSKDCPCHI